MNVTLKLTLMVSVVMLVVVSVAHAAELPLPIVDTGAKLGAMTTSGVLGVVALGCIAGMVVQYKDSRKDREKMESLIGEVARALGDVSETIRKCTK